MFRSSGLRWDFGPGSPVARNRKAADPLSGSAAWRLPISWSQLDGGLQALVPGTEPATSRMSPLGAAWRSRTTVVVPKSARVTSEAWPQMGAPKYDGMFAGIWMLL